MDMQDRLSTAAGAFYAFFFYIKLSYGNWDMIILWGGNLAVLLGLFVGYRQYKKEKKDE